MAQQQNISSIAPNLLLLKAKKEDGAKAVPNNIHDLVKKITELFTDGSLDEDTLDDAMKALSDAYWAAKEKKQAS